MKTLTKKLLATVSAALLGSTLLVSPATRAEAAPVQAVGATAPGTTSSQPSKDGQSGSVFTATASGTSTAFRFYARGGTVAQRFTAHVFATDSSGRPTTRLGTAAEATVNPGQPAGWVSAALPGVAIQAGSKYLLALSQGATGKSAYVYYTVEDDAGFWRQKPYPGTTSSWDGTVVNDHRWSFALDVESGTSDDTIPPTVPGNLRSTGKSATSVSLAWDAATDNVGVTGYEVLRDGQPVGTPTGTTYTDGGLTANTAYSYTVRARDATGNRSPASSQLVVTTGTSSEGTTAAERYGWGTPLPGSDEFNYGSETQPAVPDQTKWSLAGGGVNKCWPGHNENGRRCDANSRVVGNVLRMIGEADGDSGWLASKNGRQYGRWEARVRSVNTGTANGREYHPLLIIWPDSNSRLEDGEYDYLENGAPGENCAEAFIHYPHDPGPVQQEHAEETDCGAPLSEWHNLALEWTKDHVAGFIDGKEWFRFSDGATSTRECIQCMSSGHQTIQLDNFHGDNMTPARYEIDWYREYAVTSTPEPAPGRVVPVSTSAQLSSAFAAAQPGDVITLADGEYSIGKLSRCAGTAEQPIVVKAARRGGATITDGQLEIAGCSHVTVEGLTWRNDNTVKLTSSHHVRITRNDFRLTEEESLKWLLIGGANSHHNRIDHNDFHDKTKTGNYITIDGSESQQSQYDLIDHNHFRDVGPRAANEMEAIRVGWSEISQSSGFTTIEHNLFENCDGDPEIVSVKSNDNIVRYNTFKTSAGVLSARHGNRGAFYGNYFLGGGKAGTGGIRVYGQDHQIYNNYFADLRGTGYDAPLSLDGGDVDSSGALNKHWRVYRATVANNTFVNNTSTIEIGKNYNLPPVDSTIVNNVLVGNSGPLVQEFKPPVRMRYRGNIAHPTRAATVGISQPAEAIRVTDPLLTNDGVLHRLSSGSPAVDSAAPGPAAVTDDFDGQPRDTTLDVGADELSDAPILRKPATPADVGPAAP